jgi:hypothetical protein
LTKPPVEYFPRRGNGSFIITTQNKEIALKMVDHKSPIEVKIEVGAHHHCKADCCMGIPSDAASVSSHDLSSYGKIVREIINLQKATLLIRC